jgi:lysozyme family protein
MNFDQAFERLIGHEGGYVNHPHDPGGETKFGISRRAFPMEDIANLTLERAKFLYRRDYWGPAGCDLVPDPIRFDLFDMAVHSGAATAIKALQRAVGEHPDGVLGPLTLQALQSTPAPRVVARFNAERLYKLSDLPAWPAFGRGWVRRVADNLRNA